MTNSSCFKCEASRVSQVVVRKQERSGRGNLDLTTFGLRHLEYLLRVYPDGRVGEVRGLMVTAFASKPHSCVRDITTRPQEPPLKLAYTVTERPYIVVSTLTDDTDTRDRRDGRAPQTADRDRKSISEELQDDQRNSDVYHWHGYNTRPNIGHQVITMRRTLPSQLEQYLNGRHR